MTAAGVDGAGTRVLMVGAFDDALNAHAALQRRALERLGCTVATFDVRRRAAWLERLLGTDAVTERLGRALAQAAPDIVLVAEQAELGPGAITALRLGSEARWLLWLTGDTHAGGVSHQSAPVFDHVLAAASDLAVRLPDVPHGRRAYLPLGCDPSVHRPMPAHHEFRANVVFVGTATARREALLGGITEFGLAVWGPGWSRTSLRDYCRGDLLTHAQYVCACAGASVAVNVHQAAVTAGREGRGCNRRVFELAAIGTPQLVDDREDLARHFVEGEEVLVYRSAEGLRDLVREALRDPVWSERIAAAGRRRALAEHTYMHRMRTLLAVAESPRR